MATTVVSNTRPTRLGPASPRPEFCPACGASLGPAARPAPAVAVASAIPAGDPAAPVALALHFPHLLLAGCASTVRIRIANRTAAALEHVEVALDARGFAGAGIGRLHRLEVGRTAELLMEIEPVRAGHFVLEVSVVTDSTTRPGPWRGARPLCIKQAPGSDVRGRRGRVAKAGLGGAKLRTLDDLLDLELPEAFTPLPLEPDPGVDTPAEAADLPGRLLHLPAAFAGTAQPGGRCLLRPLDGAEREILLVAGPEFRLGRSRTEADFVTWFWPRTPENDERTMRLSKVQVELRAAPDGIHARDADSANGTFLEGIPLGCGEASAVRLGHRARLLLAREYGIDLEHLATGTGGPLRIAGADRWRGPAVAPAPLTGAVRFVPRDSVPAPFFALWLFTAASFGSGPDNALPLAGSSLAEIQGRMHFHRGCFWLENAVANAAVAVDGRCLARGEIVPLATGMRITLGRISLQVEIGEF